MPYINQRLRDKYDDTIEKLVRELATREDGIGDINYIITRLFHRIMEESKVCYLVINSLIGVFECAKLELYRMIATKYEDKKRRQNGPISDLDSKTMEDVR